MRFVKVFLISYISLLIGCSESRMLSEKDVEVYQALTNYIADIEMPLFDSTQFIQHTVLFSDSIMHLSQLKQNEAWLFKYPKIEGLDKPIFERIISQNETASLSSFVGIRLDSNFTHFNYELDSNSTSMSKMTYSPIQYDSSGNYAVVVVKHKLEDPNSRIKGSFRSYLLNQTEGKWWIKNKRRKTTRWSRFHCVACSLGK